MVLFSVTSRQVVLLELTVPWEDRMEEAFEWKRAKYELAGECCNRGWKTHCLPVEESDTRKMVCRKDNGNQWQTGHLEHQDFSRWAAGQRGPAQSAQTSPPYLVYSKIVGPGTRPFFASDLRSDIRRVAIA
ncbi:hypothetical protein QQF64_017027 [Cirrhinus molitorella]|uniref:Uncharacterized protein n=1 Tax=Cirrhinus molitorella TaxID=172907 RepID=A0ABR3LHI2_9TELE